MTENAGYILESVKLAWGRVRHCRTQPKVNEFDTGACFVRLRFSNQPEARPYQGSLPSIDKPGLVSIYGKQYGFEPHERGLAEQATAMQRKVQASSSMDLGGHVELHTYPRMLGYAFNPVSFWYFHNTAGDCTAVLCEVNNTFGERHFYFLQHDEGKPVNKGASLFAEKHFHVSPFFPVQGQYRFRFMDSENRSVARIDYFDQGQLQLSTSVSGELNSPTAGLWINTILKYGWFTVMVITKIHWQALKLLLKGAKFHSKPTPPEKPLTEAKVQL